MGARVIEAPVGHRRRPAQAPPQSVLRRPKKGFGAPIAEWLRTLPERPPLSLVEGFDMAAVAEAWSDHRTGAADHRLFL